MLSLKKLLLIPAVMPFIAILIISTINLKQRIKLRFLIWTTPEVSIGASLIIASSSSFILGTLPYLLLSGATMTKRRKVKIPIKVIVLQLSM